MAEENPPASAPAPPPAPIGAPAAPETQWTASEDSLIVWLLLVTPFSEFPRVLSIIRELQNKRTELFVQRFLEVIRSPELTQRAVAECKPDVICCRTAAWEKREHLSLLRLIHNNNRKCQQHVFLTRYPALFHPSRTAAALTAMAGRLKTKEGSYESGIAQFREFVKKVSDEAAGKELLPFPGGYEDPVAEVQRILDSEEGPKEEEVKKDEDLPAVRARVAEMMTPKTFACLVAPGKVKCVRRPRVVFGRESPKCKPDVDLSDMNLQSISRQHCILSLAKDLNFYMRCLGNMIIVNGKVFKKGEIVRIRDADLIDIGGACFVFLENGTLMTSLREANK